MKMGGTKFACTRDDIPSVTAISCVQNSSVFSDDPCFGWTQHVNALEAGSNRTRFDRCPGCATVLRAEDNTKFRSGNAYIFIGKMNIPNGFRHPVRIWDSALLDFPTGTINCCNNGTAGTYCPSCCVI